MWKNLRFGALASLRRFHRLLTARTMRLAAHQVHPAACAWHAEENPPRSMIEGWFALTCGCFRRPIRALLDRSGTLVETLPIFRFSSALVTGLESRLIHPRKLARHDVVSFALAVRNRGCE